MLNFEAVSWNYALPPDRPESLGTLNNFAGSTPIPRPRSYVRAQKLARGSCVNKLINSEVPGTSLSCLFDRSTNIATPFKLRRTSRVSSAPANVRKQVTQSIEQHVQRLHRARQPISVKVEGNAKRRPHSSPAHLRTYGNHGVARSSELSTAGNMVIKDDVVPVKKSDPLSGKNIWHEIGRGRSAPTLLHDDVFPGGERGLSTSAKGVTLSHNKLMPTAAQVREHVKRRPQSAYSANVKHSDVTTGKHNPNVISKTASCLNLKTYSEGLMSEDQKQWTHKSRRINKGHRPLSCLT